jgi:hypothetical protein
MRRRGSDRVHRRLKNNVYNELELYDTVSYIDIDFKKNFFSNIWIIKRNFKNAFSHKKVLNW